MPSFVLYCGFILFLALTPSGESWFMHSLSQISLSANNSLQLLSNFLMIDPGKEKHTKHTMISVLAEIICQKNPIFAFSVSQSSDGILSRLYVAEERPFCHHNFNPYLQLHPHKSLPVKEQNILCAVTLCVHADVIYQSSMGRTLRFKDLCKAISDLGRLQVK